MGIQPTIITLANYLQCDVTMAPSVQTWLVYFSFSVLQPLSTNFGSNPYPVQNVCPPFEGDALEDGEKREAEVVEVGDAVVGAFPVLAADLPGGFVALVVTSAQRRTVLIDHFAFGNKKFSLYNRDSLFPNSLEELSDKQLKSNSF